MYSAESQKGCAGRDGFVYRTHLVGRRREQCIQTGGCLPRAPLRHCQSLHANWCGRDVLRTVDVDLVLLHELAELSEPLGSVDLFHFDGGAKGGRRMESSEDATEGPSDCIWCRSCVGAQKKALSEHGSGLDLDVSWAVGRAELPRGLHPGCTCGLQPAATASLARLPQSHSPLEPRTAPHVRTPSRPTQQHLRQTRSFPPQHGHACV